MGVSYGSGGNNGMMSEVNITPMVDVMLVLLIIFMVTAPMIDEDEEKRKVDMNLPVTRDNANRIDPAQTDKFILEITRELQVRVGEEVLVDCGHARAGTAPERFEPCFEQIEAKLAQNPKLQAEGELYLLADTEIPYGFVVGSMARIKRAGVDKIGMITNPEYLEPEAGGAQGAGKGAKAGGE